MDPLKNLRELCQRPELEGILYSVEHIDGTIMAVASAPEIPVPGQWMSWVFARHGELPQTEVVDQLADTLMASLRDKLDGMRSGTNMFPQRFVLPIEMHDCEGISQWCCGLVATHSRLEPVWQQAWQQMAQQAPDAAPAAEKDLRHCLKMFSTFADMTLAIEQATEKGNPDLAQQLPLISRSLPESVATYSALADKLAAYLPNQFETFQQ